MRHHLLLIVLIVTIAFALPAVALDSCPECGMMLINKFRTKFENGRSWQLYGCLRQHLYWIPTSPALVPTTPSYNSQPTSCPSCGLYLMWIGNRLNQMGRMVKQYRCTRGHIYEL